ncbi:alpha/beta hydrolase [Candidatus Saccharibacteria bacterium]|nr:alpha/beta hydrolase [Candidatus Saccharibacteria bacterium]
MKRSTADTPADYIQPLNMNRLRGRVLHLPAKKPGAPEILFVYGHHSSLERWWGVVKFLNRYAAITMPDLPGFGGMDSFYKIGKEGSIDNLADYLASFIKLRYKRRQVIVVGMSLGFVVATRMLQRSPEMAKNISKLVSFAGFAHWEDFTFSRTKRLTYYWISKLLTFRGPAWLFRYVALHPRLIRMAYKNTGNGKFNGVMQEEFDELIKFEVTLWHGNEVRTWAKTTTEFLRLNNCHKHVDMPVYHVGIKDDHYFDNNHVEQHMQVIFSEYHLVDLLDLDKHAPSVIADEKSAAAYVPPKLRRMLMREAK